MISPTRIHQISRSVAVATFALALVLSGSNAALAQDETTGDGPLFQATDPDLSVFEGIDRGDSIGTSATQGFGIAAESGGATTAGRGGGGGGGGFGGGLGGLFGGLGGAFGGQGASSQKPIIRVRLRSAINIAPRSANQVQQSVIHSLDILPPRNGLENVGVKMEGRTAILFGTVRDAKHRRMGELMLRLEPGIDRVDNRVTVEN